MPLVGVFLVSLVVRSMSRVSDENSWVMDLPDRWRGSLGRGPVRWDEKRHSRLSRGKERHVPFRDSKLTTLLTAWLSGNSRTVMVAILTPVVEAFVRSLPHSS